MSPNPTPERENEPAARTCPRCGAPLETSVEDCPRCLLRLGLEPERASAGASTGASSAPRAAGPPPTLEEVRAAFPALEVEALLGQGGMGAVFRARQPALQRTVALKVLPRALGADPSFAERFGREARALARLAHPGIVAVHDFGCADGLHYLVMEFVDGVNLRALLRRGALEPRQALSIARELCDALQYAHDEGVVHRDIKPENVLVDARGRVKVADFGLAKLVDQAAEAALTRSDQVMGTPHYMAPEQLERPLEVDHRADLFALGVVLYEMLTGSLPRGKFEPPSRRVHVDVRLDQIVLKALEHEPTRRYQQALEIKTDVDHASDEPAVVPAAGPDAPAAGPTARPVRTNARAFLLEVALFSLAWVLLGAAWNLGPLGLALGVAVVLAVLAGLVRARVAREPGWRAALARERWTRGAGFLLGTGTALGVIVLGHFLHWEEGVRTWVPVPRGDEQALYRQWAADPWALVRFLGPEDRIAALVDDDVQPRLLLVRSLASLGATPGAFTLILGGIAWLGLVVALTLHVRGERAWSRRAWHLGGALASAALTGLVVLWVGLPAVLVHRPQALQEVRRTFEVAGTADEVAERLRGAFTAAGLAIEVDQGLRVVDHRDARTLAEATLLRASAQDPFARWATSLRGPVRTSPRLWATTGARLDGSGTRVEIRAGLLDPREPELARTQELLEDVVRAVRAE